MLYYRDFFEYKCAENHANRIDKCYSANEDGLLSERAIRFPDKLPCVGCGYKLVPSSPVRTLHCGVSEVDFYKIEEDKYAESAAYHEAGHIVVAAVQHMPVSTKGIRIDQKGAGIAYYNFAKPDGSTCVGPEASREKTIRSIRAAYIAQEKFYLRFYDRLPDSGAHTDSNGVNALLGEMYSDRNALANANGTLLEEARQLVEQHWRAIETLAQTLWAKQWSSQVPPSVERRWSTQMREKRMYGSEIVALLRQLEIAASLDESLKDQPQSGDSAFTTNAC